MLVLLVLIPCLIPFGYFLMTSGTRTVRGFWYGLAIYGGLPLVIFLFGCYGLDDTTGPFPGLLSYLVQAAGIVAMVTGGLLALISIVMGRRKKNSHA